MVERRGVDFAALLASIDGAESEFSEVEKESKPPTPVADTLNLSVPARNVMFRRLRETAETPEIRLEPAPRTDSQGNRIMISGEGSELSAKVARSVAWETVVRERK